jgi:hypothetical protein
MALAILIGGGSFLLFEVFVIIELITILAPCSRRLLRQFVQDWASTSSEAIRRSLPCRVPDPYTRRSYPDLPSIAAASAGPVRWQGKRPPCDRSQDFVVAWRHPKPEPVTISEHL